MSSHDPFWGMPEENWGPTSSFNVPIAPPLDDPLVAPLVQLPCVNVQWVPIILGCLAQLTDPGVWLAALTDDQRSLVLNRVDSLRSAMAGTVSTPCCDVQMRLTDTCVLQFRTSDTGSWMDVTDWVTNFGNCVRSNIPLVPPPNPAGSPTIVLACNLAGFLATKFLQEMLVVAHTALVAGNNVLQYFQQLAADIATGNPLLEVLVTVANDLYPTVQAQPIADVASASTDPSLWADVTCVIYNCIKSTGYVNASNFSCIGSGLAAIPYPLLWVPPMLSRAWDNLGLSFVQQAEYPGALDDVDCADCGEWCFHFDFKVGQQGFAGAPGAAPFGSWTSGVGWQNAADTADCPTDPFMQLYIVKTFTPTLLNFIRLSRNFARPQGVNACFTPTTARLVRLFSGGFGGTLVHDFVLGTGTGSNTEVGPFSTVMVDTVAILVRSEGIGTPDTIDFIDLGGPGANPFGATNCNPF